MLALLLLFITLLNQTSRHVQCDSTPTKLSWHQKLKSFFRTKPKKKPVVISKLKARQSQIPKTVGFILSRPPIYHRTIKYTPLPYKTRKYVPAASLPLESSLARNVRNGYERESGFTDANRKKFDAQYLSDPKVDEEDVKVGKDRNIFDDGLDKPVDYTTFSAEIDEERYDVEEKNRGRTDSDWTDNKEFVHPLRLQPALLPPSRPMIDVNGIVDVGAMFGMKEPLRTVTVGHNVLPVFEAVHAAISQPIHVSTAHNNNSKQGETVQAAQLQQFPSTPIDPKTYLTAATQSTQPTALPTLNPNIASPHFTPADQGLSQQHVSTPALTINPLATPNNSNNPIVPPITSPNQTVSVSNGQISSGGTPGAPPNSQTSSSLGNVVKAAMPIVNAALPIVATAFPPAGAAIAAVNAASPLVAAAIPFAPDASTLLAGLINNLTGSPNSLGGTANSVLAAGSGLISAANSVLPSAANIAASAKSVGNSLDPRNLSPPNVSDLASSTKNAATNLLSNVNALQCHLFLLQCPQPIM
uniref:Uncharacterized protein n=1 Tax=Ditylenchus dipsaci TaxID=166011 RepID=A0A915CMX9_9BILA